MPFPGFTLPSELAHRRIVHAALVPIEQRIAILRAVCLREGIDHKDVRDLTQRGVGR